MSTQSSLDQSALLDAFEAYWAAGVTDKGLEDAIRAYLDRLGLLALHDEAVAGRAAFHQRIAVNAAQAKRELRFEGISA